LRASCLKQIVADKPGLLAGHPEGVHQMRVGLRRLRAAISLFSNILEVSETSAIKSELKWLTEELGPAREFEVFLKRVLEPARRGESPQCSAVRTVSQLAADTRDMARNR
jgi:CHAD domain-containing protein